LVPSGGGARTISRMGLGKGVVHDLPRLDGTRSKIVRTPSLEKCEHSWIDHA